MDGGSPAKRKLWKVQKPQSARAPRGKGAKTSVFLPKICGSVCPAGLFSGHPFFRGLSGDFLDELSRATTRHTLNPAEIDEFSHQRRQLMRGAGVLSDLFERQDQKLKHRIALTTQGVDPTPEKDGLHLTVAQESSDLQALFNNSGLGMLSECYIYGMETCLGLCKTSAFTVQVTREPLSGLYFLPRAVLVAIVESKRFEGEAKLLRERTLKMLNSLCYEWFTRNPAKIKIRLFANMSGDFRQELLRGATIRFVGAGTVIRKTGEFSSSCFCVYQGDAEACVSQPKKPDEHLMRVSHAAPQAWAAWWGFLQAIGPGTRSAVTITAVTDCVLWDIGSAALAELRVKFPTECAFFDKVALKHVQMLAPYTEHIMNVPMLRPGERAFLHELDKHVTSHVKMPGEEIVKEGEDCDSFYFLALGVCSVYRGGNARRITFLQEASFIGENALLGIPSKHTATVVCDTVCDVRQLARSDVEKSLVYYPREARRLEQIGDALHGSIRKVARDELRRVFKGFSEGFIKALSDQFYDQPLFSGQALIKQYAPAHSMFVLTKGKVDIHVDGVKVTSLEAPQVLGENALLNPGVKATANVTSTIIGDCLAMHTDRISKELHSKFPEDMQKLQDSLNRKRGKDDGYQRGPTTDSQPTGNTAAGYFFSDRDPAFLADLSQRLTKQVYFGGQVIMEEGVEGNYAYIIKQGTCSVEVDGAKVGEVHPGGVLGEMVLLGLSSTHTATVKSMGTVVAFAIENDQMAECLSRFPKERDNLLDIMFERQKHMPSSNSTPKVKTMRSMVRKVQRMRMLLGHDSLKQKLDELDQPDSTAAEEEAEAAEAAALKVEQSILEKVLKEEEEESPVSKGRKPLPGRREVKRWLKKRLLALERAEELRRQRDEPVVGLVPATQGFRIAEIGRGTPFAQALGTGPEGGSLTSPQREAPPTLRLPLVGPETQPSALRLRKTESVYGRPVWAEVFGAPLTAR